jgi:hypothetical protein
MFADVVAADVGVFGAGVPLGTTEHGPAAVDGGLSSVPHPASTRTTPASRAVAFFTGEIRITRR